MDKQKFRSKVKKLVNERDQNALEYDQRTQRRKKRTISYKLG